MRTGAGTLAIPSATMHACRPDNLAAVDGPVLDLCQETATYLADSRLTRPVVPATAPTAALRFLGRVPRITVGAVRRTGPRAEPRGSWA